MCPRGYACTWSLGKLQIIGEHGLGFNKLPNKPLSTGSAMGVTQRPGAWEVSHKHYRPKPFSGTTPPSPHSASPLLWVKLITARHQ